MGACFSLCTEEFEKKTCAFLSLLSHSFNVTSHFCSGIASRILMEQTSKGPESNHEVGSAKLFDGHCTFVLC